MDKTNGFISWQDADSTWDGTNWDEVLTHSTPSDPVYRNGQQLKPGESRPVPFWVRHCEKDVLLYNGPITNSIMNFVIRFRLCGVYSRHYDRVRKFRKKRLL
ncbi:MAG: hypothetical protein H8D45_20960 [Bacteroidetes bacterium]|nr:hypothetical protein [Bacteroidota bacterium]